MRSGYLETASVLELGPARPPELGPARPPELELELELEQPGLLALPRQAEALQGDGPETSGAAPPRAHYFRADTVCVLQRVLYRER